MENERIEWVDIAKGIAILLVCLAHRNIPSWLSKWIYAFHLPLFFFLAGYTTNYEKYKTAKDFALRKLYSMVIPYFTLGCLWIALEFCFRKFYLGEPFSVSRYFFYLLVGRKIGSSWFITALLVVEFIGYVLNRLLQKWRIAATAAAAVCGFLINRHLQSQWIWNTDTALIGLVFFEAAHYIRRIQWIERANGEKRILLFVLSLICSVISVYFNSKVDMLYRLYGHVPLFLLGAFSGILFMIACSMMMEKLISFKRVFVFLGSNTLPIIFFHYYPGYMYLESLFYKAFGLAYDQNRFSGSVEGFIYTAAIILLLVPVILLINRFFPWAVGKKKTSLPKCFIYTNH